MGSRSTTLVVCLAALGLGGCRSRDFYVNRDVVRVAVLPPWNDTSNPEASERLWPHVERAAARRGYEVVPRERVEAYFQRLHFGTPEEIQQIKPGRVCEALGVQGAIYSQVTFWGKEMRITSSYVGVRSDFWLVEGATGEKLWAVSGEDGEEGGGFGLGNLGTLLADTEEHAPKATAKAFQHVPHAGFDPKGH